MTKLTESRAPEAKTEQNRRRAERRPQAMATWLGAPAPTSTPTPTPALATVPTCDAMRRQ